MFIDTVYSLACRSIYHIGICHSCCSFPLVIQIWKWSFFLIFLKYFICQQTFGILRKANITSNDFIIMIIIIIIIIEKFLTYPIKMKEREASLFNSFFSFHLICNKMFHKLDYCYYYYYYYISENCLLIIHQASYAFAKIKS